MVILSWIIWVVLLTAIVGQFVTILALPLILAWHFVYDRYFTLRYPNRFHAAGR